MNVPRRVRHDHRVLAEHLVRVRVRVRVRAGSGLGLGLGLGLVAEHLHREVADVAVDELRLVVPVEDVRVEPVGGLVRIRVRVRVRVRVSSCTNS